MKAHENILFLKVQKHISKQLKRDRNNLKRNESDGFIFENALQCIYLNFYLFIKENLNALILGKILIFFMLL